MSYLVIARKWRPQNLDQVIGQPHVTRTLRNAIQTNRVAHAYLFTGARGVGKTSVARILAKSLNCQVEKPNRPCNTCSNCREITQSNSVDVLEIDGASNRGIDNIRELRETVRYRPAKSEYKVYIIDEVHMLTTEAFNALLKTLEEPPEHVIFIFATTEPHKIPATILSRCQRFDFRRIPTSSIVQHLKNIAQQESSEISESVLYAIAREADGSMRDAQSLFEQTLAFSGTGLTDHEILDVLGVVDRRSVFRAGDAVLDGNALACLEVVEDLYVRGIDCKRFCQHLCDHFRNLLFVAVSGDEGDWQLELPEEERDRLKDESRKTTPESLHLLFQMLLKGEEDIRRSSLPKIALEMLLVRLAKLPTLESLDRLLELLSLLENRMGGENLCLVSERVPSLHADATAGPSSVRPSSTGRTSGRSGEPLGPDAPPSRLTSPESGFPGFDRVEKKTPEEAEDSREPEGVHIVAQSVVEDRYGARNTMRVTLGDWTPDEVVSRWSDFLHWLQRRDPVLATKLDQSQLETGAEGAFELNVQEVYEDSAKEPQSLAKLMGSVGEFFGRDLEILIRSKSPAKESSQDPEKAKRPKSNPKLMVMEHPIVQQALEVLGAELLEIKTHKKVPAGRRAGGFLSEGKDS